MFVCLGLFFFILFLNGLVSVTVWTVFDLVSNESQQWLWGERGEKCRFNSRWSREVRFAGERENQLFQIRGEKLPVLTMCSGFLVVFSFKAFSCQMNLPLLVETDHWVNGVCTSDYENTCSSLPSPAAPLPHPLMFEPQGLSHFLTLGLWDGGDSAPSHDNNTDKPEIDQ